MATRIAGAAGFAVKPALTTVATLVPATVTPQNVIGEDVTLRARTTGVGRDRASVKKTSPGTTLKLAAIPRGLIEAWVAAAFSSVETPATSGFVVPPAIVAGGCEPSGVTLRMTLQVLPESFSFSTQ